MFGTYVTIINNVPPEKIAKVTLTQKNSDQIYILKIFSKLEKIMRGHITFLFLLGLI